MLGRPRPLRFEIASQAVPDVRRSRQRWRLAREGGSSSGRARRGRRWRGPIGAGFTLAAVPVVALALAPRAVGVVPPSPTAAKIVTVCPDGSCDFTSVNAAVNDPGTAAGDAIDVERGSYDETVTVGKPLDIHGDAGGPPPVITNSGNNQTTFLIAAGGAGTTVQHLDIRAVGGQGSALVADGAVKASDLLLTGSGACARLVGTSPSQLGPNVTAIKTVQGSTCVTAGQGGAADLVTGVTVSDEAPDMGLHPFGYGVVLFHPASLTDSTVTDGDGALELEGGTARRDVLNGGTYGVRSTGGTNLVTDSVATAAHGGDAVLADTYNSSPNITTLRNVTAVAPGAGGHGLEAADALDGSAAIDARNVIARGGAVDLVADPAESPCPPNHTCSPGALTISYSNFRTSSGNIAMPVDPHNQSGAPLFVNGLVGPGQDFHLASPASPVIGAGIADPSDGPTDRDGVPHPNPPSIGAYEFVGGASGGGSPPGAGSQNGGPHNGPAVAAVRETISPRAFRAAASGPSVTAAKRSPGAKVSYTLNQPAVVGFTVEQAKPGRRARGGRCVEPTRANRRARPCRRLVALHGSFTQTARTGVNSFHFTGRLAARKLRPGNYRLVATPTADGLTGHPARAPFRIIK